MSHADILQFARVNPSVPLVVTEEDHGYTIHAANRHGTPQRQLGWRLTQLAAHDTLRRIGYRRTMTGPCAGLWFISAGV